MQLRTKTLVGEYDHITSIDDALDQDADGFKDAYRRAYETGDFSHVPRKGNAQPVVFRLRHLTTEQYTFLQDIGGKNQFLHGCVAMALVGISETKDEDGNLIKVKRAPSQKYNGWDAVIPEQMEWIGADEKLIASLGMRVMSARVPRKG